MDKKYEDSIHRTGRIGIIIGIILMLGIPAVISSVYDVWPESAAQVKCKSGNLYRRRSI